MNKDKEIVKDVKELLSQYTDLVKENNKINKKIKKLREKSSTVSDVVQNGYKRHKVISGVDLVRLNKLDELEAIYMIREASIIAKKVEIEKYIEKIPKSDVRQIFEHRYIDGMDWYQVAVAMGYNYEDTARKKHDRFLEKNI